MSGDTTPQSFCAKRAQKSSSPYTVGFRAPPVADTARKASRCRPQVRERIAEARAENGEGAKLSDCVQDLSSTTEGEITRGRCLHRGVDEHQMKRRSFAFYLAYIKCFRTYSVYLSFRHGVLILYRRAPKLTASERKIVTKETHQGCLSFLFKSPLLAKARRGRSRAVHRICKSASHG